MRPLEADGGDGKGNIRERKPGPAMHDLAYRDAVAAAMLRPLTADEHRYLGSVRHEQRIGPGWDAETRRFVLAGAEARMLAQAVRAIVQARSERGALLRERAALQDRQTALLLTGIRDAHRIAWSRSRPRRRWGHLLDEVLTGRFVPRDEPLGPEEETLG